LGTNAPIGEGEIFCGVEGKRVSMLGREKEARRTVTALADEEAALSYIKGEKSMIT